MNSQRFSGDVGCLTPLMDEDGFQLYNKLLWYRTPLFDYKNGASILTYTDDHGNQYQLDHHFDTDGGSIPFMLRAFPGIHLDPFNFLRTYLYHDCGYQYGGIYIKYLGETDFKFRLRDRDQTDGLLENMLPFDGATKVDQVVISSCVRIGSPFVWNNKKASKQREQRRIGGVHVYDRDGVLIEDNPYSDLSIK